MRIPNQSKKWTGMFAGSYFGDIWQTYNIDLEKKLGRLLLSDKMRIITDSSDVSTLAIIYKILRTDADATDRFVAIGSAQVLETAGTDPTAAWAADTTTGTTPTDAHDAETHESNNGNQRLVVTRATNIALLNRSGANNTWTASWWQGTLSQGALNSVTYHPVARLQRLLLIGDRELLHTIDKNDTVSNTRIRTQFGYEARCIEVSRDRFWIGMQSNFGRKALIVEWDGTAGSQNNEYELNTGASFPLCGFIVNNIPYFIDEMGYIHKFSGGGFNVFHQFPVVEERLGFATDLASTNMIVPHAAFVDRHLVYINVGAPLTSRKMRSGIWVLDTINRNLYHHMGLGHHKTAGTDLGYGGTPYFRSGAVIRTQVSQVPTFIAGGSVYSVYTGTTRHAIHQSISSQNQASNAGRNRGYFITPYIPISEVEEMWEGLWVKFKRFVNSNNRIIAKYRVLDPLRDADGNDESVLQATGTWVNTTSFTSVVPTGVTTGMEVEVMAGDNAGCSFNISTLSATPDGATTITVTIDEAAPTSSTGGALFNYDNWLTLETISSTTVGNQKLEIPRQAHGEFIQLKVELRGFGVEIDELIPFSKTKTSAKQT